MDISVKKLDPLKQDDASDLDSATARIAHAPLAGMVHPNAEGMAYLNDVLEARLPQLFSGRLIGLLLPIVHRLVDHKHFSQLLLEWSRCRTGVDLIRHMHAFVQPKVICRGLENVPGHGGCLLVANHPTGLIDGMALFDPIRHLREDVSVFAFSDITAINPRATDAFIPVEWRQNHQTTAKSRETLRISRQAFKAGRIVTIFPSGRLSYWNGLRIAERPWKDTFISLAKRRRVPIIPVHIGSRNSLLYYGLSTISANLRDLQSINEMQNKFRHPFRVTFGEALLPDRLEGPPNILARKIQHYVEDILPARSDIPITAWLNQSG